MLTEIYGEEDWSATIGKVDEEEDDGRQAEAAEARNPALTTDRPGEDRPGSAVS